MAVMAVSYVESCLIVQWSHTVVFCLVPSEALCLIVY